MSESGTERPSDCPECGGSGFVTGDTGPGEAECLDEDCPTGVFEVRDDGLRADGGYEIENDHVIDVTPAPAPQTIECPGCDSEFKELIQEDGISSGDCPECGAWLRYDQGRRDPEPEDTTEQTTLTDGGTRSVPGPRGNPSIPCHECGTEERFMAIKRSNRWSLEYVGGGPEWVAYCPGCADENRSVDTGTPQSEHGEQP